MKVEIESHNQGYVVRYHEKDGEFTYVYKVTEEFKMLCDIAKRFLKLSVKVEDK